MARLQPLVLEPGCRLRGDLAALQVVVDLVVGDAELRLVKLSWAVVQQIGGGSLGVEPLLRAQVLQDLPDLPLVQREQGATSTPPSPYLVKKPVMPSAP